MGVRKIKSDVLSALDMSGRITNSARSSSGGSWERQICFSAFSCCIYAFYYSRKHTNDAPCSKSVQEHIRNCFALHSSHIPRKIVGHEVSYVFLGTCEMTGP